MTLLTSMRVPGTPDKWRALAFDCGEQGFRLSHIVFELSEEPMRWGFDALHADPAPLGVPTVQADAPDGPPPSHDNLIQAIDHVVYSAPDLDAAIAAFNAVLDDEPRRRARPRGPQGPEMAFYRVGDAVLEIVAGRRQAAFGGIAFRCEDLDRTVAAIRATGFGSVGDPKTAVQGGRIASVWTGHTGMPIAIMEPRER